MHDLSPLRSHYGVTSSRVHFTSSFLLGALNLEPEIHMKPFPWPLRSILTSRGAFIISCAFQRLFRREGNYRLKMLSCFKTQRRHSFVRVKSLVATSKSEMYSCHLKQCGDAVIDTVHFLKHVTPAAEM